MSATEIAVKTLYYYIMSSTLNNVGDKRRSSSGNSSTATEYGEPSEKRMAVYGTEISEIVDVENENMAVATMSSRIVEMCVPDNDKQLCIFKTTTNSLNNTWLGEFMYNMQKGNATVVYSDSVGNDLEQLCLHATSKLNLDDWADKLYPDCKEKIVVEKPATPRVVYQIGLHMRGGKIPFYFFDMVYVRRLYGKHGEFMVARWNNLTLHNAIYANFVKKYNGYTDGDLKMQDSVVIKMPNEGQTRARNSFIKTFYKINKYNNKQVFDHGIAATKRQLCCNMFQQTDFEKLFMFQNVLSDTTKSSEEIKMFMYAVVEGYKQGKTEVEMESINRDRISEKTYHLCIQPTVFFHVDYNIPENVMLQ